MATLFYLLCGFAMLGAIDVGYFHIYRFKLYRQPSSRGEHVTHLIRMVLFLAALIWVMFVDARGPFSLALPVILLADFVNSMVDVLLEPRSRVSMGGLPPGEYFIHMVTMFVSGAIMAVAVVECLSRVHAPPRWGYQLLLVPPASLMLGLQTIVVTLGLCLYEAFRFMRPSR